MERLEAACSGHNFAWEVVLVNDGSSDQSWEVIRGLSVAKPNIRGFDLSRNFGKEVALIAGLDHARGDAVVFMDADLQHPPECVPELVAVWRQGGEVVDAVRDARVGQGLTARASALLFYQVFRLLSGFDLPADVGDFRLIDGQVADTLRSMRERHRLTKGLVTWMGYRNARIPYRQEARSDRQRGMSAWSRLSLAVQGLTSFSSYPLRIWSAVGFILSGIGLLYIIFRVIRTLIIGIDVPGFESIIAIMLFFGGLQLITLGILGEYIGRIYEETKGRPLYVVRERTANGGA
jgi:glycosyltransferase involved in cell wall biosynthesis